MRTLTILLYVAAAIYLAFVLKYGMESSGRISRNQGRQRLRDAICEERGRQSAECKEAMNMVWKNWELP